MWAVFEPRSNTSRRNIHQIEYATAFDGATHALIRVPEPHDKVPLDQQLDINRVCVALSERGIDADSSREVADLTSRVIRDAKPGDAVLVMSNGAFGGFVPTLLDGLRERFDKSTG